MTFDIHRIIEKLRLPKQTEYRTISAKAHHDWRLIILVSALLIIAVVAYNISIFSRIETEDTATDPSSRPLSREAVSQKTLQSTIDHYKAKSERLVELKANRPNDSDPSL